ATELLGHSSPTVTRAYIDPRIVQRPQAADVLPFPDVALPDGVVLDTPEAPDQEPAATVVAICQQPAIAIAPPPTIALPAPPTLKLLPAPDKMPPLPAASPKPSIEATTEAPTEAPVK